MDKAELYNSQAAYCASLLHRVLDPRRRALIERERQDWLVLAYQHALWNELAQPVAANAREPALIG